MHVCEELEGILSCALLQVSLYLSIAAEVTVLDPLNKLEMGRRKSNRKPPPKRKAIVPLDILFDCPFCNHEKSCEVIIQRNQKSGRIACRICQVDYQTITNFLTEPIDVYNDWIDACEKTN